ncbi:C-type lectin domain family 4 member e [Plakobranchus ocellatus]|uniref:C-type lectin domain family 4 member e n=1 Tax=Plakobranchus ocellatus TaxID=259542 RepID=A0AAV3ZXH6_9GAST|nr:C-type lectin domain family 4 member e [Plakobranchus ocellatus]
MVKVTDSTVGSERLGPSWTDSTLVTCSVNCFQKYSLRCQTIMYNSSIKLCTPGSFLKTSSVGALLAPNTTEGDLYAPKTCDNSNNFNYVTSGGSSACMLVSDGAMGYDDAVNFCSSLGAHLFVAHTFERLALLPSGEGFMIGLTDRASEGTFAWDDNGETISTAYSDLLFKTGEPNNAHGVEDCVTVVPNSILPSGNDFPCHMALFRFVCERPMIY